MKTKERKEIREITKKLLSLDESSFLLIEHGTNLLYKRQQMEKERKQKKDGVKK